MHAKEKYFLSSVILLKSVSSVILLKSVSKNFPNFILCTVFKNIQLADFILKNPFLENSF